MNTAFNLPPAKRDGELLEAARANKLIEAANRLASMQVRTVRTAGMPKSGLLVSKENAVLALSYRDAAKVLGNAATVDLVTPYSGKFAFRAQNGRNGSGGTIDIDDNGDVSVIPPARSGGVGTRRTVATVKVKVGGVQKTISTSYVKTGGVWLVLSDVFSCADVAPEYRSKTSTYTLCGHSEFPYASGGVSLPPKKYRTKTADGTLDDCATLASDCSGAVSSAKYVYSGQCTYNISTCAETNTLTFTQYNDTGVCPATTLTSATPQGCNWADATAPATECYWVVTVTKTLITRSATGVCCNIGTGLIRSGSNLWALTDEDTEDDAIARANALVGWDGVAASVATSDARGAGDFSGSYVYVEWRAPISGLTAGSTYSAKARYGRRAYGSSDPFVFFAEGSVSFTATGGSEYTPYEAIPNESGYETNVISARVCLGA